MSDIIEIIGDEAEDYCWDCNGPLWSKRELAEGECFECSQ
jgi:hypothetical protein